jgi:esterase/lipase superfamily enzyme
LAETGLSGDEFEIVDRQRSTNEREFCAEISNCFSGPNRVQRQVLIFVHGFNTSFDDAIRTAGRLAFDLKFSGVIACFDWPSLGALNAYIGDGNRLEASEPAMTGFLNTMLYNTGAEAVHVIAHSMGNRLLLRAVQQMRPPINFAESRFQRRFESVILAAPDNDVDSFEAFARRYGDVSRRTTMYVSRKDLALRISGWLNDGPRAGFNPPVTVIPGIDTVDVSQVNPNWVGHTYYADSPEVLNDMASLLHRNGDPRRRSWLRMVMDVPGGMYWIMLANR